MAVDMRQWSYESYDSEEGVLQGIGGIRHTASDTVGANLFSVKAVSKRGMYAVMEEAKVSIRSVV